MNMYGEKCVMVVMVDGKPLKERYDGTVEIPENSEYTLRFKNKNTQDVLVKFTIDGEDASGGGYVLSAGETADIERFASVPKKFKFVDDDSDEAILDGKNNNSVPGLISAKFYLRHNYWPISTIINYQKPYIPRNVKKYGYPYSYEPYNLYDRPYGGSMLRSSGKVGTSLNPINTTNNISCSTSEKTVFTESLNLSPDNTGVTVEGSHSNQNFGTTFFDIGDMIAELKIIMKKSSHIKSVKQVKTIDPEIDEINKTLISLKQEKDRLIKLKSLTDSLKILEQEIRDLQAHTI